MIRTTIFKLTDDIHNLEDVKDKIITISHKEELKNIEQELLSKLDETDRIFVSKWREIGEVGSDLASYNLPNGKSIRFMVREAYVESSRRKNNMFQDGKLLPKEQRTIIETVQTVFIELQGLCYAILFTSNTISINKVKKLFNNYLSDEQDGVEPDIANYRIDPDLFYWLFYIYEEKNKIIEPMFEVTSITGFIGNVADETHTVRGNSDNTPSLLVTKAFVCKYHPFRSLDVVLKFKNYRMAFILNDISECYIRSSCSIPNLSIDKKVAATLIIYGFIIPYLYSLFCNDDVWKSEETKLALAKKTGVEVIKEIAEFHGLQVSDILGDDARNR